VAHQRGNNRQNAITLSGHDMVSLDRKAVHHAHQRGGQEEEEEHTLIALEKGKQFGSEERKINSWGRCRHRSAKPIH